MDNSANTLLIKNLPKSVSDISSILPTKPLEVKPFGRQRMLISYANEVTAQNVLEQLQQIEVAPGKRLNAIIFRKMAKSNVKAKIPAKATTTSRSTQTKLQTSDATVLPEISKYVSKLYACESKLNFEQPPPPYLKYAYPRITPDILDAISIALMSNTRFYTQVLHLMNRMNLEPPFAAKPKGVRLTCGWPRNVATQTTEEIVVVAKSEGVKEVTVPTEKSESELESSDEDVSKVNKLKEKTTIQIKRKAMDELETQYKKKARQLLQATMQQKKCLYEKTLQEVVLLTRSKMCSNHQKLLVNQEQTTLEPFTPPTDLSEERLTEEHLLALPIYKNYQIGAPSNKLYIKNLAKDVCEEDLKTLYARFIEIDKLEVKVMQQGRMKGQAFVTFNGLSEVDLEAVVAKALAETNGFVLRQKPMVVCYGKKQLGLLETIYVDGESAADKSNTSSYLNRLRKPQLTMQPYKYLICVDFEATCWENHAPPNWREPEIIEFPAVLVNMQTGKVEAEFQKFVMPIESPKLSAFCTELTGIKQKSVDDGMPLQTAIMMFQEWLRKELRTRNLQLPKMSKDKPIGTCAFVTWTDWDFGVCLAKECQRKRLKKPTYFNQWIDLRAIFREWYKYRPINFADAISHVGLTFKGREHSGIDDARNLASLAYKIANDGAPLAITKDLAPFQLNSNCIL
ncbi:unnamed protein product [Ceratitis capitata]|uniref:(Mediterranean fruit fly) hypothetical protein n=1 Tax=Ceratitis capitata TaxID=7213 RepID=A0A811V9A5_CERCA|nr:unnamed protein product [Ceratitis capitata]